MLLSIPLPYVVSYLLVLQHKHKVSKYIVHAAYIYLRDVKRVIPLIVNVKVECQSQ